MNGLVPIVSTAALLILGFIAWWFCQEAQRLRLQCASLEGELGTAKQDAEQLRGRYAPIVDLDAELATVKQSLDRVKREHQVGLWGDLELLAKVDEAHETLSGPATKKILEREFQQYKKTTYARLATISVAHIYNLRQRRHYRECWMSYTKTRPVQVAIGERRRPDPQGRPGYLRVDAVHQGDLDGVKGVYHINAVDEVTQWQVVASVSALTQSHLEPVLRAILAQFPFSIRGFHSDNGSEFINETVSGLLQNLLIEQTKSRARKSNDNGLVESKNGAVIRKHMGYGYIAAGCAQDIDAFYRRHFNPYLNFHRPCGQPERIVDPRGKEKYVYRRYATPWEVLRELERALPEGRPSYLKSTLSLPALDLLAKAHSDTEGAQLMQAAKRKLFLGFRQERKTA